MKNKDGFTLIELIVVIALLGIISVVVGLNITNMMNGQNKKQQDDYQKKLEDAACAWADISNIETATNVKFDVLINKGLIRSDIAIPNAIKGAKTVAEDTKSYIQISFTSDKVKVCTYKEGRNATDYEKYE